MEFKGTQWSGVYVRQYAMFENGKVRILLIKTYSCLGLGDTGHDPCPRHD